MSETPLERVPGIGPTTRERLDESGIRTAEALAGIPLSALASVPGFGPVRATRVQAAARALLEAADADESRGAALGMGDLSASGVSAAPVGKPKAKKGKKSKKSKKSRKEKKSKKSKKEKKGKKGKKAETEGKKGKGKKGRKPKKGKRDRKKGKK